MTPPSSDGYLTPGQSLAQPHKHAIDGHRDRDRAYAAYEKIGQTELNADAEYKRELRRQRIYQMLEMSRNLDALSTQLMQMDFVEQAKQLDAVIDVLIESWVKERTKLR